MLEVNNFFIMQQLEPFTDRIDAGRQLAQALQHYAGRDDLLVLALPRGGVPVAYPIAQALRAELDLMLVRKLGLPNQPEFAMGAIGSGGVRVLQAGVPGLMGVTQDEVDAVTAIEQAELARRERRYRGDRPPCRLAGRCVILVDDGIATGSTMLAAVEVARRQQPARLVVAVPVAAQDALDALRPSVDELVCLVAPARFRAVGQWYRSFGQTGDEEVQTLLAQSRDAASQPYREEPR
ncbi:phosphoribosyltransferase [Telluria beijingensis]|uniref:phosphoribosyltransferase n=1 Tax=Telluria beijingensis TaxID=3068633 RepID=UPI002795549E|nr:phosphoribosyltransferase [Massilia sp. REN29]